MKEKQLEENGPTHITQISTMSQNGL